MVPSNLYYNLATTKIKTDILIF